MGLCIGPNTATGYTSVLLFAEVQVNLFFLFFVFFYRGLMIFIIFKLKYIMKLIKPNLEHSILSIELTPEANKEYNEKIQARITDSVFTLCGSWYRLHKEGKIISVFPG